MDTAKIALFKGKKIRKTLFQNEWWFSILDVVAVLTETPTPKTYWAKIKERDKEMSRLFPFWEQLKLPAEDGIEKRMRGIAIREELTDEWQKRGAKEQRDYEILTAEISKSTFGVIPSEYKRIKGLKRENLRDHMDDFELIFSMLGERSTTEIHKTENSKGVSKLKQDAKRGGRIAGIAKEQLEKEIGRPVVSKENFLPKKKSHKKFK